MSIGVHVISWRIANIISIIIICGCLKWHYWTFKVYFNRKNLFYRILNHILVENEIYFSVSQSLISYLVRLQILKTHKGTREEEEQKNCGWIVYKRNWSGRQLKELGRNSEMTRVEWKNKLLLLRFLSWLLLWIFLTT